MSEKLSLNQQNPAKTEWDGLADLQNELAASVQSMMDEPIPTPPAKSQPAQLGLRAPEVPRQSERVEDPAEAMKREFEAGKDREVMYAILCDDYSRLGDAAPTFNKNNERQFFETANNLEPGVLYGRMDKIMHHLPRPDQMQNGSVVETTKRISGAEESKIISSLSGYDNDPSGRIYVNQFGVGSILEKYGTALEFESLRESMLLKMVPDGNQDSINKFFVAFSNLREKLYGIQSTYVDSLMRVDVKLANYNLRPHWENMNSEKKLFKDAAVCALSKNQVKNANNSDEYWKLLRGGMEDGTAEDAAFGDGENNVFAVFDGIGGAEGGREAARSCREKLAGFMEDVDFTTEIGKRILLNNLNGVVRKGSGGTTAVITKIIQGKNGKELHYAAVGDSRLYVIRKNGQAEQITNDDNVTDEMIYQETGETIPMEYIAKLRKDAMSGNAKNDGSIDASLQNYMMHGVSKSLGHSSYITPSPANVGAVPLYDGDQVVLCTDGITGDVGKDIRWTSDIERVVKGRDANLAATHLMLMASKRDDRTAMVINV